MPKKLTLENFLTKVKEKHPYDRYDYSKIIYINSKVKVEIYCETHQKYFWQTPHDHLSSKGCPWCGLERRAKKRLSSQKEFENKANKIHNYKYDYSKTEYINDRTKLIIICNKHGEFVQTPNHHLRGDGCPKCSTSISKMETAWLNSLGITERQYKITIGGKETKVDGFDPKTNTVYEFYGDFWHGNPKIYDSRKINLATNKSFGEMYFSTREREELIKLNYKLITMWESDWKLFSLLLK